MNPNANNNLQRQKQVQGKKSTVNKSAGNAPVKSNSPFTESWVKVKSIKNGIITVNMTNNNTVNGDSDLDGIVTKLTDMLYEELNTVAAGVHV